MNIIEPGKTLGIIGSSATGKTTLLVNLINHAVAQGKFDVIILFTLSPNALPLKNLDKSVIVAESFYIRIVNLAFAINRKTNNRYQFLFILDDILNIYRSKTLEKMFLVYRNSGISSVISTQYAKILSPAIRNSLHKLILTGSKSYADRQVMNDLFLKTYLSERSKHDIDTFLIDNTSLNVAEPKFILLDNLNFELKVYKRKLFSENKS